MRERILNYKISAFVFFVIVIFVSIFCILVILSKIEFFSNGFSLSKVVRWNTYENNDYGFSFKKRGYKKEKYVAEEMGEICKFSKGDKNFVVSKRIINDDVFLGDKMMKDIELVGFHFVDRKFFYGNFDVFCFENKKKELVFEVDIKNSKICNPVYIIKSEKINMYYIIHGYGNITKRIVDSFLIKNKKNRGNSMCSVSYRRKNKIGEINLRKRKEGELLWGGKPVIYLYPEKKQDVRVGLDFDGELVADYPRIDKEIGGWEVIAEPDGRLVNKKDGKEYFYLFWEGDYDKSVFDMSKGFVVRGEDTREFLQEKLSEMGLTPREYNEFIVYWYPKMMNNKYNLIHFAGESYTKHARLDIVPKPDSVLRVFMVYKALDDFVEVEEQVIDGFERDGFTVVEWGGTEIR